MTGTFVSIALWICDKVSQNNKSNREERRSAEMLLWNAYSKRSHENPMFPMPSQAEMDEMLRILKDALILSEGGRDAGGDTFQINYEKIRTEVQEERRERFFELLKVLEETIPDIVLGSKVSVLSGGALNELMDEINLRVSFDEDRRKRSAKTEKLYRSALVEKLSSVR